MLKELLLSSSIVLIAGCNSKYEYNLGVSLDKSLMIDKHLQKSEKITIKDSNETKILLTATYLNSEESIFDEKNIVNEKFIIGYYQVGGMDSEGLISDNQDISIHIAYPKPKKRERFTKAQRDERAKGMDRLPISIKELSYSDPMLKSIPIVNRWSRYYLVEFPHSIDKRFTLTYRNKIYGVKPQVEGSDSSIEYIKYVMNFAKNGKYIYLGNKKLF
jgi:hypothetical protein